MRLEGKNLFTKFLRFVSATAASLMVFSLYSMVDGLMIARGVGEYAMSAVNLALPFTNALFSVAVMLAVGTSTVIAICLAQKQQQKSDALFSQNLTVLFCMGVLITVLVFLFQEQFAKLLGADSLTLGYVKEYLTGLAPFSVCFLVSYNLEILIKTDGYPQVAMYTVIAGCLANCVMDYVAIFHLGLGVFGAAVATGLSQFLTCIIYLIHFFGEKCTFHLRKFRFDLRIYRRILPIGFSDGITELCTGLMIFLFNRTLLRCIGTDGVVTYTIIAYVNTIIINLMMGISQGSQPLASYYFGKREIDNCRRLLRYGLSAAAVLSLALFVSLYAAAPQVVKVFFRESNMELASYSVHAFRQYSMSYLLVGTNVVIGGFLTALERPKPAICISVGRGLVFQSTVLLILAALGGESIIWFTPVISEVLCLCMSLFFLRQYLRSN